MPLLTFNLSADSSCIIMRPNDLLVMDPTIDYREIDTPVKSIKRLVLEKNDVDGINIILESGEKLTLNPAFITSVGAITGSVVQDYGLGPVNTFGSDSVALLDAFKTMLGWL